MRKSGFSMILLAALLGVASPWVLPIGVAHATTVAPLSVEQLTDASTYIVRGQVAAVWVVRDAEGRVWTRVKVAVVRTFKGPDSPAELVIETLGGVDGEVSTLAFGAPRFSESEEVLLFVSQNRSGRLGIVGWSAGKYNLRRAPGERRLYAATVELDPRAHYDGRFLPHPEPQHRMYVEDLESRISARLQLGWDGRPIPGIDPVTLQQINTPDRRIRR